MLRLESAFIREDHEIECIDIPTNLFFIQNYDEDCPFQVTSMDKSSASIPRPTHTHASIFFLCSNDKPSLSNVYPYIIINIIYGAIIKVHHLYTHIYMHISLLYNPIYLYYYLQRYPFTRLHIRVRHIYNITTTQHIPIYIIYTLHRHYLTLLYG